MTWVTNVFSFIKKTACPMRIIYWYNFYKKSQRAILFLNLIYSFLWKFLTGINLSIKLFIDRILHIMSPFYFITNPFMLRKSIVYILSLSARFGIWNKWYFISNEQTLSSSSLNRNEIARLINAFIFLKVQHKDIRKSFTDQQQKSTVTNCDFVLSNDNCWWNFE